ncbi:MAG: bifunctional glutamate N-acetyltransferase/amino-acid acetyltransferase ArgJ [Rhodobacteraceae bacterium]|nr:bifunctional glutamate N-acetyltransferase/amino-acid acetyltransferase ArgJ [Paracoccaceae bacterium]
MAADVNARIAALKAELLKLEATLPPPVSPLAPADFPTSPRIEGVRFAVAKAGVKYKNRTDVMLAELCEGTQIAGVFTRSTTRSAPVLRCEEALADHTEAPDKAGKFAILVNSGNANAFTGGRGFESVDVLREAVAASLGCPAEKVFTSSTGVIGEPLNHGRIAKVLDGLKRGLDPARSAAAAKAIMTTDTFPKGACAEVLLDGVPVKISGFAKGSGMIAPDMATMLVYIFTDAKISQAVLQQMLWLENASTFNCITVDGDTSTSDTLLLAATGQTDMLMIDDFADPRAREFRGALRGVMRDLAQQVARDGEGASKLIEVRVTGANSSGAAHRIAMSIANSPLVKTAVAGEDPNWGRVVMAVGKAGERADRDRLTIRFGDILVAENGWVSPGYTEEAGAAYMKQSEIVIAVDIGLDSGKATVWTCDLTHQYITINADYRS